MIASQPLSQSTVTLRDALRSATHARHAAIDRALMPPGDTWTVDRYVRFLRGTLAVLDGAEAAIARTLPAFATDSDSRVQRLQHDLRALGDDAVFAAVPLSIDAALPAAAFGAAYVIEGSMLGGQHVACALERDLALDADRLTYLRAPGAAVGPRWSAFVAALDAFGTTAAAAEWRAAEHAAAATFAAFAAAFRREGLI